MTWTTALSVAAATCSALTGGVYLAFTTMVLPTLSREPEEVAAPVMRSINSDAVRPGFMILFFGGTLLCVATGAVALASSHPQRGWLLAGALLGVAGTAVTIGVNVPLNDRLAATPATIGYADYSSAWGPANLLRAGLAAASCIALAVGLARG